jgi:hypothetical protein
MFGRCGGGEMPFYEAIASDKRNVVEVKDLAVVSAAMDFDHRALPVE